MIISHLPDLLQKNGMTKQQLLADHNELMPLEIGIMCAEPLGRIGHIHQETLSRLCEILHCEIGELIEYMPDDEYSRIVSGQ